MVTSTSDSVAVEAWPAFLGIGIVNLAIGIAVLVWPDATLRVVVVLVGLQLLLVGGLQIFASIAGTEGSSRFLGFLAGLFGIVVGLLVMREPLRTVALVVTLLGVYWVFWGLAGVISAFFPEVENRWGVVFGSLVTLALGLVLLSWPEPTLRALALIIGIFLIVGGIAYVGLGMAVRNEAKA